MPFKYDPEISDETDQKIISILYFGRKRQNEIVSLINKNKSTTINHLDYLVENHKVKRIEEANNEVYYQLEDGRSEIVPPYPKADADKVHQLLFSIKDNTSQILERYKEDMHQNEQKNIANKTLAAGNKKAETEDNPTVDDPVENLISDASELYGLTSKRYHLLSETNNFELFFDVLDKVLDNYDQFQTEERYVHHPSRAFDQFIMATNELYINYENGEENEKFASELSERSSKIIYLVKILPHHLGDSLMVLAFAIDENDGQEAFKNAVLSGNYEMNELILRAFEKYIRRNNTHKLFEDLEEVEKTSDGEVKTDIEEIKQEIKRRYYQVADEEL